MKHRVAMLDNAVAAVAASPLMRPYKNRLLLELPTAHLRRREDGTCEIPLAGLREDDSPLEVICEDGSVALIVTRVKPGEVDWPHDMNNGDVAWTDELPLATTP